MLPPDDPQTRILRTHTVLHALRPAWAGALILNLGLDPIGSAVSFAANIAGAVCLTLESDPALLRNAQRTGSCDFVVNTLDEALRAMKNEIRKHRPLSVGLESDPAAALAEITERGLAPELFTAPATHPEAAACFRSLGAITLAFHPEPATTPRETAAYLLAAFLAAHPYQLHTETLPTAAALRAFDTRALDLLPKEDHLRRQWLASAARILPRDRHRTLWLTEQEATALQSAQAV
jgi:urocanate hydratase